MAAYSSPPTAELHVHIEGTLEPDAVFRMAARNGLPAPAASMDEFLERYTFTDLQSFLDLLYANTVVLRTEEDFHELAGGYLDRAKAANVRRAEIFFDPQTHLNNGVPLAAMMDGLTGALSESERSHGISTDLIMCFLRDLGPEAADRMLTDIRPYRDRIIGIGLDSTEIGYPPDLFVDVYARARADGLHPVAHAGEEGSAETVTATLDLLQVERVNRGIRSVEDPNLVARLRDERVPLTVCPLSNVCLRAVDTLADHPLRGMLTDGLLVTVNSDDPAYFGGYVDANYAALYTELGMTTAQLAALAENSFDAAFIDDDRRTHWKAEVREYLALSETGSA